MANLREEIDEITATLYAAGYTENVEKTDTPIKATDQILTLLDESLPKKKSYLYESREDNKYIMKSAIAFKMGWNACLQEIKDKLK